MATDARPDGAPPHAENPNNLDNMNPNKVFDKMADDASSNPDDLEREYFEKFERRNWTFSLGEGKWGVRINPVSFGLSVLLIWGFAIWCMVDPVPAKEDLDGAKKWVTFTLTWAYMLSQQLWVLFLVILFFSKLGSLKLGKEGDDPEYPAASWFMMMFSAGIGIGLFFFGVAEPIQHYEPCYGPPFAGVGSECTGSRYAQEPDNIRAQWAMNITYFHWGIHAWVTYCIVGLLLGAVVYRKDLPMTMKSAFYPILGEKIFGWMGDMLDVVSVATTLFGVCTSLGLGVQQLNTGFKRLNSDIEENFTNQAIIIWSVTLLATISVVTGVKVGIRRLSEINFMFGQVILMVALFQEDTWYLLNNLVQSLGFYFQWFIQLGNHGDTFVMAPDERLKYNGTDLAALAGVPGPESGEIHVHAEAPDGLGGGRYWMDDWTIFYWGWWIAWAPFVGMFIAKISRGRTVRQIITGAMIGPVMYGFIWFAVFGGAGLRMERQAANLGVDCFVGPDPTGVPDETGTIPEITQFRWNVTDFNGDFVRSVPLDEPMIEVDGRQFWRLSCRGSTEMWFDLWTNWPMTNFYWGLSIVSLILYFVTSSDSGSLVIDCLTANGNPHPPILQRIFWSCTEGAVATALLKVGGEEGLVGLRSVSIIAGVPYTVVICLMCVGLWNILAEEYDHLYNIERHAYNEWATPIIDVLDYPTFSAEQAIKTLSALFIPSHYAAKGAAWVEGANELIYQVIYGTLFLGWLVLLIANVGQAGLWALAWVCYLLFTGHMAYVRSSIRGHRNLEGNVANDILLSMIAFPFVAVQIHDEVLAAIEEGPGGQKPPKRAAV